MSSIDPEICMRFQPDRSDLYSPNSHVSAGWWSVFSATQFSFFPPHLVLEVFISLDLEALCLPFSCLIWYSSSLSRYFQMLVLFRAFTAPPALYHPCILLIPWSKTSINIPARWSRHHEESWAPWQPVLPQGSSRLPLGLLFSLITVHQSHRGCHSS